MHQMKSNELVAGLRDALLDAVRLVSPGLA